MWNTNDIIFSEAHNLDPDDLQPDLSHNTQRENYSSVDDTLSVSDMLLHLRAVAFSFAILTCQCNGQEEEQKGRHFLMDKLCSIGLADVSLP